MSVRYSKYFPTSIFLADLIMLNIAICVANFVVFRTLPGKHPSFELLLIANFLWVSLTSITKNYLIKRPLILSDNINAFLVTLIYHLVAVLGIIYFFKIPDISRLEVSMSYALFAAFTIVQRSTIFFLLDFYRKKGYNHREVMIIGDELVAERLLTSFSKHPEYGYDLSKFISEKQIEEMAEDDLKARILEEKPDELFICYRLMSIDLIQRLVIFGDQNFIKIKLVSGLMLDKSYAKVVRYDNVPVLQVSSSPEISFKIRMLKRVFDVVFSLGVMISGILIFITLYIITKLTSKGPAFYKQERIGLNEKPFHIYKFRSMYVNAEQMGPQLSKDNDPRITKWGVIMRKTRLDELPQFWNVLKGEMSVVGPRPERQHFITKIIEKTPNYKKLFVLKPGLTSIGQVHYGYAESVDQMCSRVRYDMLYLQNINFNSDMNIILRTVKVMVQRKGK